MVKLGSKVKDNLTGFEGIAVSRVEHLHGCARICVEPTELDKDGQVRKTEWFDEQRVEIIEVREPVVSKANAATSGGPFDAPIRREDPTR